MKQGRIGGWESGASVGVEGWDGEGRNQPGT